MHSRFRSCGRAHRDAGMFRGDRAQAVRGQDAARASLEQLLRVEPIEMRRVGRQKKVRRRPGQDMVGQLVRGPKQRANRDRGPGKRELRKHLAHDFLQADRGGQMEGGVRARRHVKHARQFRRSGREQLILQSLKYRDCESPARCQLRATAVMPANGRGHKPLSGRAIDFLYQQPGPTVRHSQVPGRCADAVRAIDLVEQLSSPLPHQRLSAALDPHAQADLPVVGPGGVALVVHGVGMVRR